jgi:hypothetical protein
LIWRQTSVNQGLGDLGVAAGAAGQEMAGCWYCGATPLLSATKHPVAALTITLVFVISCPYRSFGAIVTVAYFNGELLLRVHEMEGTWYWLAMLPLTAT